MEVQIKLKGESFEVLCLDFNLLIQAITALFVFVRLPPVSSGVGFQNFFLSLATHHRILLLFWLYTTFSLQTPFVRVTTTQHTHLDAR